MSRLDGDVKIVRDPEAAETTVAVEGGEFDCGYDPASASHLRVGPEGHTAELRALHAAKAARAGATTVVTGSVQANGPGSVAIGAVGGNLNIERRRAAFGEVGLGSLELIRGAIGAALGLGPEPAPEAEHRVTGSVEITASPDTDIVLKDCSGTVTLPDGSTEAVDGDYQTAT